MNQIMIVSPYYLTLKLYLTYIVYFS